MKYLRLYENYLNREINFDEYHADVFDGISSEFSEVEINKFNSLVSNTKYDISYESYKTVDIKNDIKYEAIIYDNNLRKSKWLK